MGFWIRNYQGNVWSVTEGCVIGYSETKTRRTVILDLPSANKDIIQDLGFKSRRFTINGTITFNSESSANWFRNSLVGYTGSISGSDDRGYITLPLTQVFYSKLDFEDRAGRPFEKNFKIEAVEVI